MQAISNPPYCFYIFIRCNGLYFLSDIAYMHIQSLCFTHIWLIPRIFEYILLAKHLLRVFKQQFQYCKFLFCNLRKRPATDTYLKGRGIIELVYIVLQSVVKPGITGFFKIDLHIKCYIYLS